MWNKWTLNLEPWGHVNDSRPSSSTAQGKVTLFYDNLVSKNLTLWKNERREPDNSGSDSEAYAYKFIKGLGHAVLGNFV